MVMKSQNMSEIESVKSAMTNFFENVTDKA